MNRPTIEKQGNAVTLHFTDDRQARDYAALATEDVVQQTGTRGEKAERGVSAFFDGLERTMTRFAEGATGTIGIFLLAGSLAFLAWHSWHGWWGPMGLAPLSTIGPVLVLMILGFSLAIAQSKLEELQAAKVPDDERVKDEQAEQKAYAALRWAAVIANAVAAISFQTTLITDSNTGRAEAMAKLRDLRIERSTAVSAQRSIEDEAYTAGRMSPSAQSSERIQRDIERMFRQPARNQMNEPIKGKTVGDVVGDCSEPKPNWQTYYEVYCPAILDRQDELDAVTDWEAKQVRISVIDTETDAIAAGMPAAVGAAEQSRALFGSSSGLVLAGLIALVFAAFEFLLGKLTYHWRLTKLKREFLK